MSLEENSFSLAINVPERMFQCGPRAQEIDSSETVPEGQRG